VANSSKQTAAKIDLIISNESCGFPCATNGESTLATLSSRDPKAAGRLFRGEDLLLPRQFQFLMSDINRNSARPSVRGIIMIRRWLDGGARLAGWRRVRQQQTACHLLLSGSPTQRPGVICHESE
jgi:hypothetical protein